VTSPLVVSVPTEGLARDLQPLPENVEVVVWPMTGPAPCDRIDIVVPPYQNLNAALGQLAGVEVGLVQSQSIGYEGIAALLPAGVPLANAAGVHETSTAELAVGLAIASLRRLDQFARDTATATWNPVFGTSLADRRVLVLGWGGVGKAIGARLIPFEVDLTAVASRARDEDGVAVHGVDELADLLPRTEVLILALPGGDSTRHIIDAAALALLPDGALVVNVGRGPLIDTDALVAETASGRLRAALDVTDPEPLPADHPLWRSPGVLIAPHVGGASSAMRPRLVRVLRDQITRAARGAAPINIVVAG
jgi:phosphoglycerate dehydrogenase-like enzyme